MSLSPAAPCGAASFRLTVETEPRLDALSRLLESFVIHDVLPGAVRMFHHTDALRVEIDFRADADLARRLLLRSQAMVSVRDAACVPCAAESARVAA